MATGSAAPGPFGGTAFVDALEFQGTRDPSAWLTVPAALEWRAERDWAAISAACRTLVTETAARVAALTGLAPLSSPAFRAPHMASMPVPDCDPAWLKSQLYDRYAIEIPSLRWRGRNLVRISIQCYNTPSEAQVLLDALSEILEL